MNLPAAILPLFTAAMCAVASFFAFKWWTNPEAAMSRHRARTGLDYVGPDRDGYLRKRRRVAMLVGIGFALSALLQLVHAGFRLASPTPEELQRRREASDREFRMMMERDQAELERQPGSIHWLMNNPSKGPTTHP